MIRSIRRPGGLVTAFATAILVIGVSAGPALACGGLIGPNGAVNLLQTTTLAAYHDGEEHYVTAFQFAGGGGAFGSLTPLPGIPSSVEKGGDWTLQRLVRETEPPQLFAAEAAPVAAGSAAEELLKVRIDALDITVLRGGSTAVVRPAWRSSPAGRSSHARAGWWPASCTSATAAGPRSSSMPG